MNILARAKKARSVRVEAGEDFPEVVAAAAVFIRRKNRTEHPPGKFDSAGRWYASEEIQGYIRAPSRAYPYSQMVHCRTLDHVAWFNGVDVNQARTVASLLTALAEDGQWSGTRETAAQAIETAIDALPRTDGFRRGRSASTAGVVDVTDMLPRKQTLSSRTAEIAEFQARLAAYTPAPVDFIPPTMERMKYLRSLAA